MDLFELIRTALRRWYVVLPVLLLSAVAGVMILQAASEEYETSGSFLLSALSLDGEEPHDTEQVEGITDVRLLADVLNLDGRAGPATNDPSQANFEASTLGDDRMRIDVYGDDPAQTLALLEEQLVVAEQAVADEVAFEVLAQPEQATPSNAVRGAFQASALLRVDDAGGALGGAISGSYASRVVGEMMRATEVEREVLAEAPEGSAFTIQRSDRDQAPIMDFTVVADSPEASTDLLDTVVEVAETRLDRLQASAGVAEELRMDFVPLAQTEPESLGIGEGRRPALAVFGLGVVLALGLAVAVDGAVRRRSRPSADPDTGAADTTRTGWDDDSRDRPQVDDRVGPSGTDLDEPHVRTR